MFPKYKHDHQPPPISKFLLLIFQQYYKWSPHTTKTTPILKLFFIDISEHLVCSICLSLSFPDEDVQSAAMFILVYIFEGCWEDHLSPRQREQLCEDLVCVLNSAKTQILMMNSLGNYQNFALSLHVLT